jgi:pyruvate dehydrogenase (quinone)
MSRTVGDFIVERLHAWGVRHIFGYPGDGWKQKPFCPAARA